MIYPRKHKMAKTKKTHGGNRKGSGRKPLTQAGDTMKIAITLPGELLQRLDALAETRGLNRSEAVREGVQLLLDQPE